MSANLTNHKDQITQIQNTDQSNKRSSSPTRGFLLLNSDWMVPALTCINVDPAVLRGFTVTYHSLCAVVKNDVWSGLSLVFLNVPVAPQLA